MTRFGYLLSLLALLLLISSCGARAKVSYDKGANWSRYKTFAQAPAPKTSRNLVGYSAITGRNIQEAIAANLKSKGFSEASLETADLLVVFAISGQQREDVQSTGYGYGYGGDYTVRYVEGTMVIDIYDHKKKQLLFHGYDQEEIFSSDDEGASAVKAAEGILAQFPPTPKS